MRGLRQFLVRLANVFTRHRSEDRLNVEIEEHIALQTQENIRIGMPPAAARRQALIKFGATEAIKETYRDRASLPVIESTVADVKYGLRSMRKSPGFTAVAVLSLAVGIGATTAVFSIVYATLLHPYPFRDWERLVTLTVDDANGNLRFVSINGEQLRQLREASVVEGIVAYSETNLSTTGNAGSGDLPEDVACLMWTTNAIEFFGVPPVMGRGLGPADAPEGQEPEPAAMLSYLFWQRRYGGDKNVLDQAIELEHVKYRIVGVASPTSAWEEQTFSCH